MPPPARGCLRSDGLAPGEQAGVAGAALARRVQQEQTRAARADACSKGRRAWQRARARGGAGRHEATCHPRLGGACEATASQRQGRRGSLVPPGLAESKGQAGGGRRCRPGSLKAKGRGGITGVFSPGGKTYTACTGKRDPARRACGQRRVRGKTPGNCARNDNCPFRNCPRRRRAGGCWRCA